jgi:dTDP-glucose 4,6-dehydratase
MVETDWDVICPVTFRHRGRRSRIDSALDFGGDTPEYASRVKIVYHDLRLPFRDVDLHIFHGTDYFLSVASESHVDRSIDAPREFIKNNVDLMIHLLDLARIVKPSKFLHMSTDEVYGPAYGDIKHREWDPIRPSNPYSASKAAQEAIAFSYWRSYGVPVVITNTMNIVGEMQHPEKFIPMVLRSVLRGDVVKIHADGETPGSRHWLHARNLASAWLHLLEQVVPQQYESGASAAAVTEPHRFHVVGEERDNLDMAMLVATYAGKVLRYKFDNFHASRPGHDLRYALDGSLLESTGWKPPVNLEDSLKQTVEWTLKHRDWLDI